MFLKTLFEQILSLLKGIINLIFSPVGVFLGFVLVIYLFVLFNIIKKYKTTTYYKLTKEPYLKLKNDTGKYGEYLIYDYLKDLEKTGGKFLFNIYLPKKDGKTTEIDVLLITKKGLFVFESKNYSGYIYGNEKQRYWTQVLNKNTKKSFFNPIMQNNGHISALKYNLTVNYDIPIKSIIVFSERSSIQNIAIENHNIKLIQRSEVLKTVKTELDNNDCALLTPQQMQEIYDILLAFTQVSDKTKEQHIKYIKE